MKFIKFSPSFVFGLDTSINSFKSNLKHADIIENLRNQVNIGRLNAWNKYLNNDDWSYEEFISDNFYLQRLWAKENNVNITKVEDIFEIALVQIEIYRPDVVFLHDQLFFTPERLCQIRLRFPKIKLLTGDGTGKRNLKFVRLFDGVVVNIRELSDFYLDNGINVLRLRYGIEIDNFNKYRNIEFSQKEQKLVFAGSIVRNLHERRRSYFKYLFKHLPPHLFEFAINVEQLQKMAFKTRLEKIIYKKLGILNHRPFQQEFIESIMMRNRGQLFFKDYFDFLSEGSLILNIHIDSLKNDGGNIRFLEAAMVGSVVVTDYCSDLDEICGKNNYIGVKNLKDAKQKIQYYLRNSNETEQIAGSFRKYVLERFQYDKIFDEFKTDLLKIYGS